MYYQTFIRIYNNIIRLLTWHVKSENRKELEKNISEELYISEKYISNELKAIVWHPLNGVIGAFQKIRKKIESIFNE